MVIWKGGKSARAVKAFPALDAIIAQHAWTVGVVGTIAHTLGISMRPHMLGLHAVGCSKDQQTGNYTCGACCSAQEQQLKSVGASNLPPDAGRSVGLDIGIVRGQGRDKNLAIAGQSSLTQDRSVRPWHYLGD